ncbi:MAG: GNAT family N-acetyltransferase [Chloroflexi bacterium]|nr:GNAT family N-acetyltransferase [Chloroflexota bacterium]
MKPGIRTMTIQDKPAVMAILRDTPEFLPSEVVVAEELLDCYLCDSSGSGYHMLLAEVGSRVAGYICYGTAPMTEGTWDIYWIAVDRQKQGQGIGTILMEAAEKRIKEARGRHIFIETSSKPEYEKTRRFHYGQGYQTICQIPDFYAPGDDKLILRKLCKGENR